MKVFKSFTCNSDDDAKYISQARVDNLIFDSEDPSKVLAVLDWELSTLGDPLADAAYGCIAHHIPADMSLMKVKLH